MENRTDILIKIAMRASELSNAACDQNETFRHAYLMGARDALYAAHNMLNRKSLTAEEWNRILGEEFFP